MRLFAELTHWTDHVGGQTTLQEIAERYADSAYDLAQTEVFASIMATRAKTDGQTTLVKAMTTQDPQVRDLRIIKDNVYARRKVLGLMLANLERDAQVVSRELTRRTSREPRERHLDAHRP